ncbi:CDP-alcohol phosphatidyltransferase family protein [Roseomonas sp. BN140053]|uniref:CDP-alcohol phosphatidyltransferase family protein n=1 Tax=Roseomonas sp. BN140053 TaxID=3391898 RepID=UPI0039EA3420
MSGGSDQAGPFRQDPPAAPSGEAAQTPPDAAGRVLPDVAASALAGAAGRAPPDAAGVPDAGLLTVPNIITFARLCAVPAAVWLIIQQRLDLAFLVFVLAGVSDGIDGWYARVFNVRSALGAALDPVADKGLLVSVYVTLAWVNVLPDWLAILVVFRDVVIVGGVVLLTVVGARPAIRPLRVSKVNTALQIALAAVALLVHGFHLPLPGLTEALVWLVAASTLLSGAAYVRSAVRPAATP